jgi:hypothetical protein
MANEHKKRHRTSLATGEMQTKATARHSLDNCKKQKTTRVVENIEKLESCALLVGTPVVRLCGTLWRSSPRDPHPLLGITPKELKQAAMDVCTPRSQQHQSEAAPVSVNGWRNIWSIDTIGCLLSCETGNFDTLHSVK